MAWFNITYAYSIVLSPSRSTPSSRSKKHARVSQGKGGTKALSLPLSLCSFHDFLLQVRRGVSGNAESHRRRRSHRNLLRRWFVTTNLRDFLDSVSPSIRAPCRMTSTRSRSHSVEFSRKLDEMRGSERESEIDVQTRLFAWERKKMQGIGALNNCIDFQRRNETGERNNIPRNSRT